ncbi:hypothetical protein GGS20DRAFT_533212, partial [Poronia punctata]
MVWAWQRWLSPRPLRRTETPVEPRLLSPSGAALFEFVTREDGRMVVRETHYANNKAVQNGLSGPKLHIHLSQTEYFEVLQGTLAVIRNGKEHALTKEDGVFEIPAGTRHRFWAHPSIKDTGEDIIFNVWAEPNKIERGFDENCLRNYLGYLKDCEQQQIQPSVFQIALFGWSCDTPMIVPDVWLPIWALKMMQNVAAHVVGAGIL